jgi:hypothetical protein
MPFGPRFASLVGNYFYTQFNTTHHQMTNKFLLLAAAAGTLALASCQNESGGDAMNDEMMQAKIDSAVQARMGEMQAQLAAQNDSLINAMAMMKADSMMAAAAAAGNNNTGIRRTVPTRPGTRPATTPRPTTTPNTTPAPTGKNNGDQGTPTGKGGATNSQGETNEGTPTGKRR